MAVLLGAVNVITAKTKKNQSNLNKAIDWGKKHFRISDARDRAYDDDNMRLARSLDRQAESSFDKYTTYLEMLPKAEQKKVDNYVLNNYNK